jgi:ABC-type transport system involved in multi-copper enzyme maturation permease subunit
MVARLWWKEARLFWPIWALLAVLALAAQGLTLHFLGQQARSGGLLVLALGWTILYAFAVAAAAFAGEREHRTLLLLDSLPVQRWRLWIAKASFALVSTLALGILLVGSAALTTDIWRARWPPITPGWGAFPGFSVLVAVLGWGLFWSSVTSNALVAAALAICSALLVVPAIATAINPNADLFSTFLHLAEGITMATASALLFIRSGPPRRPVAGRLMRFLPSRSPAASAATAREARRRISFCPAASRALAWQTFREVRSVTGWLALIGLGFILAAYFGGSRFEAQTLGPMCSAVMSIVAGISAFGIDSRARTQAFLANHGVRPGLVWLIKTLTWLGFLVAICGLSALILVWLGFEKLSARPSPLEVMFLALVLLVGIFAVSVLCGMVIRRGITAGVVAVLLLFLLIPPVAWLFGMHMLPSVFLPLLPLAFLFVTFAWSTDWLLDRPGARKWLKLALIIAGTIGALFTGYATHRAASIPALDPAVASEHFRFSAPTRIPAKDNAADLYREAIAAISDRPPEENLRAMDLIRKAAKLPACQFSPPDELTVFTGTRDLPKIRLIPALPAHSVRNRQARGDLESAWSDLMVMFRVARQWSGAVPLAQASTGLGLERLALSMALLWAADSRQTPQRLRAALAAYRELPHVPDAADPIRAEAQIALDTMALPRSEWAEHWSRMMAEPAGPPNAATRLWVDFLTTPWEMARARKAFRLLYASKIEEAKAEPWYAGRRSPWHGGG